MVISTASSSSGLLQQRPSFSLWRGPLSRISIWRGWSSGSQSFLLPTDTVSFTSVGSLISVAIYVSGFIAKGIKSFGNIAPDIRPSCIFSWSSSHWRLNYSALVKSALKMHNFSMLRFKFLIFHLSTWLCREIFLFSYLKKEDHLGEEPCVETVQILLEITCVFS